MTLFSAVVLVDPELVVAAEVSGAQGQHFTFTTPGPEQDVKGQQVRFVAELLAKHPVLLLRDDKHFSCGRRTHGTSSVAGVHCDAVEGLGVVEQGRQLGVDATEIGFGVGQASGFTVEPDLLLPFPDIEGRDLVHLPLSEVGDDLGLEDV